MWDSSAAVQTLFEGALPPAPSLPFDLVTNRFTDSGYTYDGAGNLTSWPGGTASFDAFGMIVAATGAGKSQQYIYTAADERIAVLDEQAAPDAMRWTLRGLSNKVLRTFDSALINIEDPQAPQNNLRDLQEWIWQKDYVYRGDSLLAAAVTDNVGGERLEHFHLDHLGTPRLRTDAFGVELARHKYLPYGEELTDPSLDSEVMRFTSHERDRTEAGFDNDLDYMHARYYSMRAGRFLSLDPVLGVAENPQSWNRYAYVLSNPISLHDPDGRTPRHEIYHNYHARRILSAESPEARQEAIQSYQDQNFANGIAALAGSAGVAATIEFSSGAFSFFVFESLGLKTGNALVVTGTLAAELLNPNPISVSPRALLPKDFGLAADVFNELDGTFRLADDVAIASVKHIDGKLGNPFRAIAGLASTAKASGARVLRIEGTLANEDLLEALARRYGLKRPPSGVYLESFEIQLVKNGE